MRAATIRIFLLAFCVKIVFSGAAVASEDSINSMLSVFSSAQETIDPIESATNKIKLSNRQKTLGAIVSNSLCFVYLGVEPEENLLRAAQASALFSETLDALRNGSVQKAVRKAEDAEVINALAAIGEVWRPMKNTVNRILTTRQPEFSDILEISTQSARLLEKSKIAALQIEDYYSSGDLGAADATTLRFVSDLRMRSQKATKEFCYILAGIEPQDNLQSLEETRSVYFASVVSLFYGNTDLNVLPPKTFELDFLYAELFSRWFLLEDLIDEAIEAEATDPGRLALALAVTDRLSDKAERALTMY